MKSGCDSSEARCSSNEGGCGHVAMISSQYVKERPNGKSDGGSENESLSLTETDSGGRTLKVTRNKERLIRDPSDRAHGPGFRIPF